MLVEPNSEPRDGQTTATRPVPARSNGSPPAPSTELQLLEPSPRDGGPTKSLAGPNPSPGKAGYALLQTNDFARQLADLPRRESDRISKKLVDLESTPLRNTTLLYPPFRGRRRFRVGDYRVIFTICEECRKDGFQEDVGCGGCPGTPDRTVTLRAVRIRGNAYD